MNTNRKFEVGAINEIKAYARRNEIEIKEDGQDAFIILRIIQKMICKQGKANNKQPMFPIIKNDCCTDS